MQSIDVQNAAENNLQGIDIQIPRGKVTVVTGVSGSGKSSLAFDTIYAEAQRRFVNTLSHYSRQFLDLSQKPKVGRVSGLSPAISIAQNETAPSRLASVASQTDLGELYGVLFSRHGERFCPEHDLPSQDRSVGDIAGTIVGTAKAKLVQVLIPFVKEKKGHFRKQLEAFAKSGFVKAWVDGELVSLIDTPELDKNHKHTIEIVVDSIRVKKVDQRLLSALEKCLEASSDGIGAWQLVDAQKQKDGEAHLFSTHSGCPECGYTWPKLDPRYFSSNSVGKCKDCEGWGEYYVGDHDGDEEVDLVICDGICESCEGTGIASRMQFVTLDGVGVHELYQWTLQEIKDEYLPSLEAAYEQYPAASRVLQQIRSRLDRLLSIGLGYLSMARRLSSLSTGEMQRLRLANLFSENLHGVLYVLDEPSQGLHPTEVDQVWDVVQALKDAGNTILLIDHDMQMIERADYVVDMGPGGGKDGGSLVACFEPKRAGTYKRVSKTAHWLALRSDKKAKKSKLSEEGKVKASEKDQSFLKILAASANNLEVPEAKLLLGGLNVVTGVSGAGKSSMVVQVLYENLNRLLKRKRKKLDVDMEFYDCDGIEGGDHLQFIHAITRSPISRSSVSMPATFLGVTGHLRDLFAKLPAAQIAGLTPSTFSMSTKGGRCETCKGRGVMTLSMRFLADAKVTCTDCEGRRFLDHVLAVEYKDKSFDQILEMTIEEVYEFFEHHRTIKKKLQPAIELGLGYLKVGQPTMTLSGGEAQRLKLTPFLSKTQGKKSILILEEPTTGLHPSNVLDLLKALEKIRDLGTTIVVIEHNTDVVESADWVVDLGPGSASDGGQLVYQGVPEGIAGSESLLQPYV